MKRLIASLAVLVFFGCSEEVTRTNSPEQTAPKPDTLFVGDTIIATNIDTAFGTAHRSIKIYKNIHKVSVGGSGLWGYFKESPKQAPIDAKQGDCIIFSDSESVWFVPDSTAVRIFGADTAVCSPKADWSKLDRKGESK